MTSYRMRAEPIAVCAAIIASGSPGMAAKDCVNRAIDILKASLDKCDELDKAERDAENADRRGR
jgi:hypothetical protein